MKRNLDNSHGWLVSFSNVVLFVTCSFISTAFLAQVMTLEFRTWLFGIVIILVIFLILVDISKVEEEIGIPEGRDSRDGVVSSLQSKSSRDAAADRDSTSRTGVSDSNSSIVPAASEWRFNKDLSISIRKNILKFLDAERDISVLKGNVQPGDIIHYVFDRERTMNIS